MKRMLLLLGPGLITSLALASSLPPSARSELAALLGFLENSDCEFYRNGSWYAGPKAASHLQRKLDYLDKRDLIASAEAFIIQGASKSSMSGEEYQVRCPGEAAVPSAEWLNARLHKLRAEGERENP